MNNRFQKNKWYQRYSKLIILSLFVIFFTATSTFIIYKGINIVKEREITYINSSNIDYYVYLKENNYFNTPFLGKDEKYIASLIDNIQIKYHYSLKSDEDMTGKYNYQLVANLVVKESGKDTILWQNEEDLTESKELKFDSQKEINVNDEITINYDKYNDIVNQFKKDYGVSIDAEVIVKMIINTSLDYGANETTVNNYEPYVKIPLSEKTIEINISKSKDESFVKNVKYTKYPTLNYFLIVIGIIFLCIYLFLGVKVILRIVKAIKNSNKYEAYIRKIFGNYDQIIVNTDKLPDLEGIDIMEVDNFEDLVDAQNEIHKPIIFNEIKYGKLAAFILIDGKHAFNYTVRLEDVRK